MWQFLKRKLTSEQYNIRTVDLSKNKGPWQDALQAWETAKVHQVQPK